MSDVREGKVGTAFVSAISEFVVSTRDNPLPESTTATTVRHLFDGCAAMLHAASPSYDLGSALGRYLSGFDSGGGAHVVGRADDVAPELAALVNGALAYACDIESFHAESITHPFAAVAPAALALAEARRRTGRELVTAIVVGIDVACRMSLALGAGLLYERAFHPSAIGGSFGATAAACLLTRLDERSTREALGLVASSAGGLMSWVQDEHEHVRPLNLGVAARNGVNAALLAEAGVRGPRDGLEGVFPAWMGFSGVWRPALGLAGLGERYLIEENRFKFYACCGFIHPGLDGLLEIMAAEALTSRDIATITLRFPASAAKVIDDNALRSHSAQYVLALAAVRGLVDFHDIVADRRVDDAEISRLASSAQVVGDATLDPLFPEQYRSVLVVESTDGRRFERTVSHPRGSSQAPATDEEVRAKAEWLLGHLPAGTADDLWTGCTGLLDAPDLEALSGLLSGAMARTPARSEA